MKIDKCFSRQIIENKETRREIQSLGNSKISLKSRNPKK
jgi:hypothetical protein